jgi:DNA replication and repair protein RecF
VRDGLPVLVEAELNRLGPSRAQVNRQTARTRRDLAEAVPVSVFSPDDVAVVRAGPSHRREVLDDALRLLDHQVAADIDEMERVLRQRAALLRQARGRATAEVLSTLAVWNERLARTGTRVAKARERLAADLEPLVDDSYRLLSGSTGAGATDHGSDRSVSMSYGRSWEDELDVALERARDEDLRRAVTSVGPHRDDLVIGLDGRDSRHQASQGEQRSVAIALRLSIHQLLVARTQSSPILLLDDVFSELDPHRSRALVRLLPTGQALLTTALGPPDGVPVAAAVDIATLRAGNPRVSVDGR